MNDKKEKLTDNNEVVGDGAAQPLEKEMHHHSHQNQPWIIGLILIGIGAIFLLQQATGIYFDNWWALFILIPAVNSYSKAWQAVQVSGGRLTSSARGAFFGGLMFTAIAAIFFFNLDWVIFGPMVLIIAGVAVLLNALLPKG